MVLALGATGQTAVGRWDATGRTTTTSGEQALLATGAGAVRFTDWLHATAQLPLQANHRSIADEASWGAGVGDLVAFVVTDPVEEPPDGWIPVPYFGLGVRAPTGRAWDESTDPYLVDVTGKAGTGLLATASVERTTGEWPYGVAAQVDVPAESRPGVAPLEASLSVNGGRALTEVWLVSAALRHTRFAGDATASRTAANLRLVGGKRLAWRAWAGLDVDLPVPGLGRSLPQLGALTAGAAIVR